MFLKDLRLHLNRTPTPAEAVAESLKFCCLAAMLRYEAKTSNRKLAAKWGLTQGHIARMKRQEKAGMIQCTNRPETCMKGVQPILQKAPQYPETSESNFSQEGEIFQPLLDSGQTPEDFEL